MPKRAAWLVACVAGVLPANLLAAEGQAPHPLDRCNVVWTAPSRNSDGSMPIGNGEVGLNVWVEEGGDLLFYIARTDAWSGNGRLLKLGRVRIRLTPNPFEKGAPFRQTLDLRHGRIEIVAGPADRPVTIRVWVDAHRPVIRVEADGESPFETQASLEVWRTAPRKLEGAERHSAYGVAGEEPVVEPDVVRPAAGNRVVWFHRNGTSCYPATMKTQGLEKLLADFPDPLLNRTFGGCLRGEGLVSADDRTLKSAGPVRRCVVSICTLTARTDTPEQWLDRLDRLVAEADATPPDKARADHEAWWEAFWERSWIYATTPKLPIAPDKGGEGSWANALPLRIGADSDGHNRFVGRIARAAVFARAMAPKDVAALAAKGPAASLDQPDKPAAAWRFDRIENGTVPDASGAGLDAKVVGEAKVVDDAAGRVLALSGKGYLEVPHDPRLDLAGGFTLEAWIAPARLGPGGGRILDKCKTGGADGYVLDTHPGNSLRLIAPGAAVTHRANLAPEKWVHVAATCDPSGERRLYVDGKVVAGPGDTEDSDAQAVTRGYVLQRWINACGGRGAYPIKFNGSLFTVPVLKDGKEVYDADYRRWGGCYWFQNTRLPYWSMPMAGDFDLLAPLFRMYLSAMPLARARTEIYYSHKGVFFPETMYFWGTYNNENYGVNRAGKPLGLTDNTYIRYYWSGSLELAALMLDGYAVTRDDRFAREVLLPFAGEVLTFYEHHYPRDPAGKIVFEPAQSLETWQEATDPTPEIAGMRHVIGRLLAEVPQDVTSSQQREHWMALLRQVPPLPVTEENGVRRVLPARKFGRHKNSENPELYAVFPYRLYGVGKRDLDVGRATFDARLVKRTGGWTQDPIQAAILGLARQAGRDVFTNFTRRDFRPGRNPSRFPAFWGPNFDWIPDQDQGGVAMTALQRMLMQCEGRAIYLLPAWPKEWDVEFRLHAPFRTVVQCSVKGGRIVRLDVTPPDRAADVVRCEPQ